MVEINPAENLKSLFQNLKFNDYKENCTDYWINYFYNNIDNKNFKISLSAIKGAQEFIDRCDFLRISLDTMLTHPKPIFSALAASHRFCTAQQTL